MEERKNVGFAAQLEAEHKKVKYRKIWLVVLAGIMIQFLWSAWTFQKADDRLLAQGYSYLLYELPLLNAIFMPVLMSVIASRLCDAEVKGDTFKLLYTMQKSGSLYDCKLIFGIRYILLIIVLQTVMIIVNGRIFQFTEELDIQMLVIHCISLLIVNTVVLTIQQFLSLAAENQILPLCVGLAGAFLGLFSMFFPKALQMFVLWGYYAMFMPLQMNYDPKTRLMSFSKTPVNLLLMVLFTCVGVLIYAGTRYLFVKREVQ